MSGSGPIKPSILASLTDDPGLAHTLKLIKGQTKVREDFPITEKAGPFNQEKALVGALSLIAKSSRTFV